MTQENPAWLALALTQLGTHEIAGPRDNPIIMSYYAEVGHGDVNHESVAWCAAFAGAMLKRSGYPIPAASVNLMAGSYEKYGVAVEIDDAQPGDICVFYRGDRSSWQRHVAFFVEHADDEHIRVLGGNQSDSVSIITEPISKLAAVRRPIAPTKAALREAGSTDMNIASAAKKVAVSLGGTALASTAASESMKTPPVPVPAPVVPDVSLKTAVEQMDLYKLAAKGVNEFWQLAASNPWLIAGVLACLLVWALAHWIENNRLRRALDGAPLSNA
jgi:uncharacterized protein (TIGR02594 family)